MDQISIFDIAPEQAEAITSGALRVVKAEFIEEERCNWQDLFNGFDEMYGITFSSGIQFMEKVMDRFSHVEMIFGCEGVMSSEIAAIMAMETKSVEMIAKSKSAQKIAQRLEDGSMSLFVSRDTKSHEKIFILKANDGRARVITGSANMSANAFCGLQREDIVCFDGEKAFCRYKARFEEFKETCSDNVNYRVIMALQENEDFLRDAVEEIPIVKTIEKKNIVILEPAPAEEVETEIIADIKGLEAEMKPMLPKKKKEDGKIVLTGDMIQSFGRKHKDHTEQKKIREKKLPKLHLDFETGALSFNGKVIGEKVTPEGISSDIRCVKGYMSSLNSFYGDWEQSQRDYYAFMNWYFASLFMPYLRNVASKNNYDITPFPVYGIIYGDSNGGKSTFIRLLSKLMCGAKIPLNSSGDFTSTNIEDLKRACEGLPINIDDLAKLQFDTHYEKVIKDDRWGIAEGFVHYPAVSITTNRLASLKADVTKRTVTCFIGTRLDKEVGAKNSRKVNESIHYATNALYHEYVVRMFPRVMQMVEEMKSEDTEYFPDILNESSLVLQEIFKEYGDTIPDYVRELDYSDYFGDKAIGKNAMKKFVAAWENDRKNFKIERKKNTLTYTYADSSRSYELRYIQQELPIVLNARMIGSSIVMDLDKAKEVFGINFDLGLLGIFHG